MHNLLTYPFDPQTILKKRKAIRRKLLASGEQRIKKKIPSLAAPPPMT